MNERRLRPVYLVGIGISAYALWYFVTAGSFLLAVVFGVALAVFVVRLRWLIVDA